MKQSFLIVLTFASIVMCKACPYIEGDTICRIENNTPMGNEKIKIKIGSKIFTATLVDSNSAKAFKKMLPLTLKMVELNQNEKYCDIPNSIPTSSFKPEKIYNGDLMVFGSKTLVLFYKTFLTSYSYTKLGSVDDVTGFAAALGTGNVTVTFTLE